MLDAVMDRFRPIQEGPEIEVASEEERRQRAEESDELRRELLRLQLRALRLATEQRRRGEHEA